MATTKKHGGARNGAGRPKAGRKRGVKVYLTPKQTSTIARHYGALGLSTAIRMIVEIWVTNVNQTETQADA